MTGLVDRVSQAIKTMHEAYMGESMVMLALEREAWLGGRPIPVVDVEEAVCILVECGWTWAMIARVNS